MRRLPSLALIFSVVGCVSDAAVFPDSGALTGDEGGPCFMDGTCKTGLVCVVPNKCAKPDGAAPMDASVDVGHDSVADVVDASCALTIPNTISYWPGDSVADVLGPNSFTWAVAAQSFVLAEVGRGFNLSPSMYPYVMSASLGGAPLTEFTIEFWIKPVLTQSLQRVISMESNSTTVWAIDLPANNGGLTFMAAGAYSVSDSVGLPDSKFSHVAFILLGGQLVAFQDGNQMSGLANGPASILIPAGATLRLGNFNSTEPFIGILDEIAIYGRALSANEINQIYMAGPSGACRSK